MNIPELAPDQLYRLCDPDIIPYDTTEQAESGDGFIGQPRAVESLHFGIGIERQGYNIFALGESGTGKYTLVREFLDRQARNRSIPPDVCYVNNFDEQHQPRVLKLKPGEGKRLAKDMKKLISELGGALRASFESEEYQNRRQTISNEVQEKQQEVFEQLQQKAREYNMTPLRTPGGLVFAPVKDGDVVPPDQLENLSAEERESLERNAGELQAEARKFFQKMPRWQREAKKKQEEFDHQVTRYTVGPLIQELVDKYGESEDVGNYLRSVEKDMIENAPSFLQQEQQGQGFLQQLQQLSGGGAPAGDADLTESPAMRRYQVNMVVDNSDTSGAPVISEENPNYSNLFGRVEHMAQMGALITDFNMIRGGALHRANGGYLVIDALKLIREPFAYEGLKRALRSSMLKIESPGQLYGLISTVSLEPEPLPLNIKVVLTGRQMMYYLLRHYDPEFDELFKVAADFASEADRTGSQQAEYARMIAGAVNKEKMKPFSRDAVARVIEHSARMAGDGDKLSMDMQRITDLLRESDYFASRDGHSGAVTARDVQTAIDAKVYRSDRIRERMQEMIEKDIVMIDTHDTAVGQINGLSVMMLADFAFGRPSRITARIRLGKGDVLDIEREVAMGGPIHSKGVLILSGFLGARYAREQPLSLSASLVFEQSYSGVEGDSASSAELYCLLSAISGIPLRQSLAVTGSVDQHGRIQAIGGVNEKIEGFYDICLKKGLSGDQGVLIPASNVRHLMLRRDVIEAVKEGRFHVYPVQTVDRGIELLTGLEAGEADENGRYPENSVNGQVHRRLAELAAKRLEFAKAAASGGEE